LPGQARRELEAIADESALQEDESLVYPFSIPRLGGRGLPYIEPLGVWQAILGDLVLGTAPAVIAGRTYRALARIVARMAVERLAPLVEAGRARPTVVLTGDCCEGPLLLELVTERLATAEVAGRRVQVLTHARIPPGNGGVALGQAAIGAAADSPRRTMRTARLLPTVC
jgi:hydrogenase maturation protein HypF